MLLYVQIIQRGDILAQHGWNGKRAHFLKSIPFNHLKCFPDINHHHLSIDSANSHFRMTEMLIVFSPRWVQDRLKRRIMPFL